MGKKSILKNYMYNMFYEILAIIIPLITTPYLSRILGAENIGIYSYTISITTYFILFGSLGIAMYGKREIAYVQSDIQKRTKTFYEIFFVRCISLTISLLIFYLSFCTKGEYKIYYIILLMEIIANMIDISWFFQGIEEFKKTVIRNTLVKIISVICIFLFVKTKNDLCNYFVIYVLSTFFGNITLWFYLPRFIKKIEMKSLHLKQHIKPTIMLFIPQVATQVYTVLDKTMIGTIISDKSEVGYYEQAQKIVLLLTTIATSLGTVMMPRIASIYSKGKKETIIKYLKKSLTFVMMLSFPLFFGLCSISNKFVPLFFGYNYDKVSSLLCIISPVIVLIGVSNVTGIQYLLPTKQQNKYTISVIIGAFINFFLNLLLISKFESIGASIATVIAELCVTATQLYMVRNIFKIKDILKISYKFIFSSLVMFLFSYVTGFLIKSNIISVIVQITISVIVYFVSLLILKEENIKYEIEKIKKVVIRK